MFESKDDKYKDLDDISGDDKKGEYSFVRQKQKGSNRLKMTIIVVSIAVITVLVIVFINLNSTYASIFKRGVDRYNAGQYVEALDVFYKIENTNSDNKTDVFNYMAACYTQLENYDEALKRYEAVLAIDEYNKDAISGICKVYYLQGNQKKLRDMVERYRNTPAVECLREYITTAPEFSKESGTYENSFMLSITAASDTPIYYTLDGTDPNSTCTLYTKPIKITKGATYVKAVAITSYGIRSDVAEANYVVTAEVDDPTVTPSSGTYDAGTTVTIKGGTGETFYYTLDGSTPTTSSNKYYNPIYLTGGTVQLKVIAVNSNGAKSNVVSRNYEVEGTYYYYDYDEEDETKKSSSTSNQNRETTQSGNIQNTQRNNYYNNYNDYDD